jgi:hypothetical protein
MRTQAECRFQSMPRAYSIHRGIPFARLRSLIPHRYQTGSLPSAGASGQAALVVFRHDRVIVSSHVRRALSQMEDVDEGIRVAAGYCFTEEGLAMLATQGFQVLSSSSSHWTDERYQHIFQVRLSELGGRG